ncbi:MAG: hypothetical protein QNJ68_06565 [Microcoleaceae cyanobacterium MO_207.B10]|nr:hypothetical protein [Microcoleaceae cyanobacterium MO_207.B10]
MAMNWKSFSSVFVFCAIATLASAHTAKAGHPRDSARTYQPFAEEFNRASQKGSGNFFRNRGLLRQFGNYFGIPRFPDQTLVDDNRRVNQVYIDEQRRQFSSTPVIRTPDLINPYDTSIMSQPAPEPIPSFGGN